MVVGCGRQAVWVIPEELRKEGAGLDSLQLYARQLYMSSIEYILYIVYFTYNISNDREEHSVIEIRLDEVLEKRGRTFYWLAKETGISHSTLWRLKKGKALGINFATLEGICQVLSCQPGDILILANEKQADNRRSI